LLFYPRNGVKTHIRSFAASFWLPTFCHYGMARPFFPASDMMLASEEGKERTDVCCDPWR
jgi:hypothetical protein